MCCCWPVNRSNHQTYPVFAARGPIVHPVAVLLGDNVPWTFLDLLGLSRVEICALAVHTCVNYRVFFPCCGGCGCRGERRCLIVHKKRRHRRQNYDQLTQARQRSNRISPNQKNEPQIKTAPPTCAVNSHPLQHRAGTFVCE